MGWDYTHATHYTRTGAIDKKAEIDELYTWQNDTKKYEVVRSCMVGATYYAAVKATVLSTGEVETFAAVALTHTNSRDYFNFGVKTMEESMGPCEDHCPASILSLLSPTDSEYANSWRERCRKNIEAKKRSSRIEKFTCRRSDPLYSPYWGKHRAIETRRSVSVQTPFLVLPIIRPLYASNQDPGKL